MENEDPKRHTTDRDANTGGHWEPAMSEWLLFVWRARNHKIKASCMETKGPLDKLLFRFRSRDLAPEIRSEVEHILGAGIPTDVAVVTGGDSLRLLPRTVASGILGAVKLGLSD